MARNIGSIEVTVDANTNRLKAQLVKAGQTGGQAAKKAIESELKNIQAELDLQTGDIKAATQVLRKQIEAKLSGIPIDLDLADAVGQLQALREEAEAFDITLKAVIRGELSQADMAEIGSDWKAVKEVIEADKLSMEVEAIFAQAEADARVFREEQELQTMEFEAEINMIFAEADAARFRHAQEQEEIELKFRADMHEAALDVFRFKRTTAADAVEVDLEMSTLQAAITYDRFKLQVMAEKLGLDVDIDLTEERLKLAAFRAEEEANAIDIPVNADTSGGGGAGGLSTRMQAIIAGIVILMEPAAVALQGLSAAATSVVSSAFGGLAGAAGAAAPAFAALGASAATLVVGFQGMGEALGSVTEEFSAAVIEGRAFNMEAAGIEDALQGLSPAARDVVAAFGELLPQFSAIRSVVQEELFAGLGDSLRGLSTDVIPAIGTGLVTVAGSFNEFFATIVEHTKTIDFSGLFASLQPIIDRMLTAFVHLFDTIEPFLTAAAPAAAALASSFAKATESLSGMISAGEASGGLTAFLMEGVQSLRLWFDLIEEVGRALFTIFEAGQASGDSFVSKLTDIVARFDDWMNTIEGQDALAEFFKSGEAAMSALVPVLEGLQGFFTNLVTPDALARFAELGEHIGQILPVLGSLFEIVGETALLNSMALALALIGQAIEPILPALDQLAAALGTALSDIRVSLGPVLNTVADAMGQMAKAITPVIPHLAKMATALIKAFTPAIASFIERQAELFEALAPLITLVADEITILAQAAEPLIAIFAELLDFALVPVLEAIGGAIEFVTEKIEDFYNLASKIPLVGRMFEGVGDDLGPVRGGIIGVTESTKLLGDSFMLVASMIGLATAAGASGADTTRAKIIDFARAVDKANKATATQRKRVEEVAKVMEDWAVKAITATGALAELAGVFEQIGAKRDALQSVFDLGNAPRDAAAEVRDIEIALGELTDAAAGVSIADVLSGDADKEFATLKANINAGKITLADAVKQLEETAGGVSISDVLAGNIEADDVLDKIDALRPEIQALIVDTFAAGGPEAAIAMADSYITKLASELKISEIDAAKLIGIDEMKAKIAVSFELSREAQAREAIDVLESITGGTPLTASLKFALSAGAISADQVFALLQPELDKAGVTVPAEFRGSSIPEIIAAAKEDLAGTAIEVPMTPVPISGTDLLALVNAGLAEVNIPPIVLPMVPATSAETEPLIDAELAKLNLNPITAKVTGPIPSELEAAINHVIAGVIPDTMKIPVEPVLTALTSATSASIDDIAVGVASALPPVEVAVALDTTAFDPAAEALQVVLNDIDATVAEPEITTDTLLVQAKMLAVVQQLENIDDTVSKPEIAVETAVATSRLVTLQRQMDALRDKTVTITVNTSNTTGVAENMAGGMINFPTISRLGERGYREAVIPMQLPLNRIDPSVRHLAELIHGGGTVNLPAGRTVNNYLSVTPTSADPGAVATQLINRSAALANR